MPRDPDVDAWFRQTDHPLAAVMQDVRRTILGVDRRIAESIKWKSPTFSFEGNIASIDPRAKAHVSLMFHQGAKLPGRHPELEGGGATVRYMRFTDRADVKRKRAGLQAAVRAWIEMKERG